MKFLCVPCDSPMKLQTVGPPERGSLAVVYSCPECGSFGVEYPQYTRKFFTPLLIEWMSNFGLFEKAFYCRKCHYTWPKGRTTGINRHHLNPGPDMFVSPAN